MPGKIRQPIVSVLGHVDHGKTTVLDYIRGSGVVKREAGGITQHIGATEVPIEVIYSVCAPLIGEKKFDVPGLLFIDTPGHHSFTTLRARGGALADIGVLVIDINEGLMPQTIESINILKMNKTPFVIAANKIDRIDGWNSRPEPFVMSVKEQTERGIENLDAKIYKLIENLYLHDFPSERYDRIEDFTRNVAIVPISAKTGEGIPDLLLMIVGLAQRFLEKNLRKEEGPGEGTILEIKEEKGLGTTLDTIVYAGTVKRGDTVVLWTKNGPLITKVKAILKPKPLDEIRDPRERFDRVESVSAAAGVKMLLQEYGEIMAGTTVRVAEKGREKEIAEEMKDLYEMSIETDESGVIVKADAIGSLEALAYELKAIGIPIKRAEVGPISRRDIVDAATIQDPLRKVILGFNVPMLPEAKDALSDEVTVFINNVVYKIVEDYEEWLGKRKEELEKKTREVITYPGSFRILPDYIFRLSKPAVVGVRVLAGRIRPEQRLLKEDGRVVGRIKSIRSGEKTLKEAIAGQEVAISVEGVTVGRQIHADDILYIDISEGDARKLKKTDLNYDEKEVLEKLISIKRKENKFWAM